MAVVVNPLKTGVYELADRIVTQARAKKVQTTITSDYPLKTGTLDGYDVCCVIGGDGTILGTVPEAARTDTPILGVNLGKLGFLATYTPEEIQSQIETILKGEFCLDQRSLIEANCEGEKTTHLALNDVVIKSTSINLMRLQVREDNYPIAEYACDGLIFATPTGSTAYNLSAGGPILHPQNHSIAMTPICAHTLSNRSVIFPDDVQLHIACNDNCYKPSISIDGRPMTYCCPMFPFHIRMAKQRIRLIHAAGYSQYQMLRTKLKWM